MAVHERTGDEQPYGPGARSWTVPCAPWVVWKVPANVEVEAGWKEKECGSPEMGIVPVVVKPPEHGPVMPWALKLVTADPSPETVNWTVPPPLIVPLY